MRLAASRNSFLRSPVGSGPGAFGIAFTAAVVSRARARALRAARLSSAVPERSATSAASCASISCSSASTVTTSRM